MKNYRALLVFPNALPTFQKQGFRMNAVTPSPALLETAIGLLLDVQAAPDDAALRAQVEAWIATSADHAQAWQEARRSWALLGEVEPVAPTRRPSAQILAFPATGAKAWRPARWLGGLAGMAAAAALILALSPGLVLRLQADQATATGEFRDLRLADGSLVHLGARSAIDVDVTSDHRRVTLLAGDAWFDVAHDAARPFTVASGPVETRVLGTAFEVRRQGDDTQVGVGRGHVRVSLGGQASDLLPGDRLAVDPASASMIRSHLPVDSIGSWRDGHLFANNTPIADVIAELRRYDRGWIILADARLGQKRVTGLYDARDPARALEALMATAGGQVSHITPYVTVVRGL